MEENLRGTGRSTARALHAIAEAIEARGEWIEASDHIAPMSRSQARSFADYIRWNLEKTRIQAEIRVGVPVIRREEGGWVVHVRSTFQPPVRQRTVRKEE